MTAAWPSYLTAIKQWTTALLSWGETSPHKECLVPLHVLITLQQLNVCFSGVRRAKSLELCLGDTQEDAHPCAGLVWSKAEPSTIQTDWILQTGKLSHRLVQQHWVKLHPIKRQVWGLQCIKGIPSFWITGLGPLLVETLWDERGDFARLQRFLNDKVGKK